MVVFDSILFILAGNEDMHTISDEFEFRPDRIPDYGVSCPWGLKMSHRLIMGKWCLHVSSFIFDRLIIKDAGNQDRQKSSDEFSFGPLDGPVILVFEMRFDLGTLDSGERSMPFGLLVSWCGSNETWANSIDPPNMAVAQGLHCLHTRLPIKNKIKWKIYQTILFTFYSPGDAHHERLRDEDDELLQFAIQQSLMDSGTEADQVLPWKVGKKFGHKKNFYKYCYIWAATWQNQQSDCAPSEDSDQPGHDLCYALSR